nr:hypothetical protein Q903MT_gene595 [Picea sitchensis]
MQCSRFHDAVSIMLIPRTHGDARLLLMMQESLSYKQDVMIPRCSVLVSMM